MIPITNGKYIGYVGEVLWSKIQEAQTNGKILQFNMRETDYNGNLIVPNNSTYIRGTVSYKDSSIWSRLDLFDGNDVLKKMTDEA